jgi:phosphatidylglycerophosphatase A
MRAPGTAWARLLPRRLVVTVATLGPLGSRGKAPGTLGSLAGVAAFLLLFRGGYPGGDSMLIASAAAGLVVAAGFCGEAEVLLGRTDPGEVVLDEFVAMPLCYIGWTGLGRALGPWVALGAGFALFRLLDILKPLGIGRLQRLPGGWGIIADDVAAALATCAILHGVAAFA